MTNVVVPELEHAREPYERGMPKSGKRLKVVQMTAAEKVLLC